LGFRYVYIFGNLELYRGKMERTREEDIRANHEIEKERYREREWEVLEMAVDIRRGQTEFGQLYSSVKRDPVLASLASKHEVVIRMKDPDGVGLTIAHGITYEPSAAKHMLLSYPHISYLADNNGRTVGQAIEAHIKLGIFHDYKAKELIELLRKDRGEINR
jgi:hypothetical protein